MNPITKQGARSMLLVMAVITTTLVLGAPTAFAQPPNDDFDGATVITGVPFTDNLDTTQATSASDDPTDCSSNGSVWYAFTPSVDMPVKADTFGSNYDTVLSAYTGSRGSLNTVACNDDAGGPQSRIAFDATGGTTYFFLVAACCGNGGGGGGDLVFSVSEAVPPPNDDFDNATVI